MNKYCVYTKYGRSRKVRLEFKYTFDGVPQVGDIITWNDEEWIIEQRQWFDRELGLVARKNGGLIQ